MSHTKGPWKAYGSGFDNPKHDGFSKTWSVGFGEKPGWRGPAFLFDMVHPVQHQIFASEQARQDALVEARANAHLIAAAPEMLEALEKLFKVHDKTGLLFYYFEDSHVEEIKNLIKKAKGEL